MVLLACLTSLGFLVVLSILVVHHRRMRRIEAYTTAWIADSAKERDQLRSLVATALERLNRTREDLSIRQDIADTSLEIIKRDAHVTDEHIRRVVREELGIARADIVMH